MYMNTAFLQYFIKDCFSHILNILKCIQTLRYTSMLGIPYLIFTYKIT